MVISNVECRHREGRRRPFEDHDARMDERGVADREDGARRDGLEHRVAGDLSSKAGNSG
jgi:hypothetical protein